MDIQEKYCSKCGITKNINEFYRNKSRKDGFSAWCKSCDNANHKRYVENNKEHIREKDRERYLKNPEKRREQVRNSQIKHQEKNKEQRKEYYIKNRESILFYHKVYYQNNKDIISEHNKKYYESHKDDFVFKARERKRTIQNNKDGTITKESLSILYEHQNHQCDYCGRNLDIFGKHLDHILPLSKGGLHSLSNVHWVCPSCNLSKSDRTEDEWFKLLNKQHEIAIKENYNAKNA